MADENPGGGDFDPCECVWSHELATRRLINMIRQNQDYCAENECFNEGTGSGGGSAGVDGDGTAGSTAALFFLGFWFFLALILFFMKPKSKSNVPASKRIGPLGDGPNFEPPSTN